MSTQDALGGLLHWTIADRLRKAREVSGHDQRELAELMGVSRATISNNETGKVAPREIVLRAWALATGVPVAWIKTGVMPSTGGPGEGVLASAGGTHTEA